MTRWTPLRKLSVCVSVRQRELTLAQACERYDLSAEELTAWLDGYDRHGLAGLKTRQLQRFGRNVRPARYPGQAVRA